MANDNGSHLTYHMDFSKLGQAQGEEGQDARRAGSNEQPWVNVGNIERVASGVAGAGLVAFGLKQKSWPGLALAALGGCFLYRSTTGNCKLYSKMGINTAKSSGGEGASSIAHTLHDGIHVENAVTIGRPVDEVYAFWRNFENLPRFMKHLKSVTQIDDRRSHWVAKGPAGMSVEWDAEIINERENELISYTSIEGSDVDNAGVIRFKDLGDRGTEIHVTLRYSPPAGRLGALVAKIFGENPEHQIAEDLRVLQSVLESGATV
ncbi:SRPBCC family protein [soil metagenome]